MFVMRGDNQDSIMNEAGDILVRDPETDTQFWVPANQIHHLENPEDVEDVGCLSGSQDDQQKTEDLQDQGQCDGDYENHKNWSHEETLLLIETYKKYETLFEKLMKKQVWKKITKDINEKIKKRVNEMNVENKWKSLKRTYKNIKLKNSQSGGKTKRWDYYILMDEIMKKKPEINPPAIASASGVVVNDETISDSEMSELSAGPSTPSTSHTGNFFKRKSGPNINDRHREKMARQDKFLELFEKLVDKI